MKGEDRASSKASHDGLFIRPGWTKCHIRKTCQAELSASCFGEELKDRVFYCRCLFGSTDIIVLEHTSFISHGRTRQSNPFNLKTPLRRTSTFKVSYFNRITKLWNFVSSLIPLVVSLVRNLLSSLFIKLCSPLWLTLMRWKDLARGH